MGYLLHIGWLQIISLLIHSPHSPYFRGPKAIGQLACLIHQVYSIVSLLQVCDFVKMRTRVVLMTVKEAIMRLRNKKKQSETLAKQQAYLNKQFGTSLRRKRALVSSVIAKGLIGQGRPRQLMTKDNGIMKKKHRSIGSETGLLYFKWLFITECYYHSCSGRYSTVHKYLDSGIISVLLALYSSTLDLTLKH